MTEKTSKEQNTSFLELMPHSQIPVVDDGSRERTYRRIKRGFTLGVVAVMFQGSSAALTSAWADGCVDNPEAFVYCVGSTEDSPGKVDNKHTLRSAVVTANGNGSNSSTIGFADLLFGIVRDSSGTVTSSTNNYQNPVVITLDSTLEIRTNLIITAPTFDTSSQNLTIQRGLTIAAGDPLISINKPSPEGLVVNGASGQVQIENVTIQSRANTANPQDATGNFATPGVTIQVASTIVPTPSGDTIVTPDVVLKSTNVLNAVSETGGAAVNTPGDVRVEHSALSGNKAATPNGGAPTDGGAIKAGGTVTVDASSLSGNSASGNGGAIAATTVEATNVQLLGNSAGGNGGAISANGNVSVSTSSTLSQNTAGGDGGAINAGGTVTVVSSTLSQNSASGNGGAIAAGGNVSVSDSTLTENQSLNPVSNSADLRPAMGGGAISAGGNVTITSNPTAPSQSTVTGNTSTTNGGAISAAGSVTVAGLTAERNTAGFHGGVISAGAAVTVTNLSAQSNSGTTGGGVISVNDAFGSPNVSENAGLTVSISDSIFVSNSSTNGDGGAVTAVGAVTVNNSTLTANNSGNNGGAIQAGNSAVTSNVTILNNSDVSLNQATYNGGAVSANGNVSVSVSSTLTQNFAGGDGGAIKAGGSVEVSSSNLNNNAASGDGGAVSANQVAILKAEEARGAVLTGNIAGGNGGAISSAGAVSVQAATLSSNTAGATREPDLQARTATMQGGNGGAISAGGDVTITQSTLVKNEAVKGVGDGALTGNGGGVSANGTSSTITVTNSGLGNNTAGGDGGAIVATGGSSTILISNSTLAKNSASVSGGAVSTAGNVDVSNNSVLAANKAISGDGGAISSSSAAGAITVTESGFIKNEAGRDGGAISATGSASVVSISNSGFVMNKAEGSGGAILAAGEIQVENNSIMVSNTAEIDGGAIASTGGSSEVAITNSALLNNEATLGNGGAISMSGSTSTITIADSGFGANRSSAGDGGAIATQGDATITSGTPNLGNPINEGPLPASGGGSIGDPEVSDDGVVAGFVYEVSIGGSTYEIIVGADRDLSNAPTTDNPSGSTFISNISDRSGGAIYAAGKITVRGGSTFASNQAGDNGGALAASEVELIGSDFITNTASGFGGAVDIADYSMTESTIQDSEFSENTGEYGGAIDGNQGRLSISSSSFFRNSATSDNGGAIWHESQLYVTGSTFSGNTAEKSGGAIHSEGDVEISDSSFGFDGPYLDQSLWNGAIKGSGGAVYSEGDIRFIRSIAAGNYSGRSGGALFAEGEVSINASLFFLNQSLGNGGAIFSETKVIVENGSLMFANTAGLPADSEFGFPFFYPIPTNQVQCPMGLCRGGNGGAIYSEGDVRVSGSKIGLDSLESEGYQSLYANTALCGVENGFDGPSPTCTFYVWNNGSEDYEEVLEVGNGGGIYAVGKVTIEGSETSFAIDPSMGFVLFPKDEASFEYSLLTNNYAENNGGAIYALGGLSVINSIFGSTPEENTHYNPIRLKPNPGYDPNDLIPNPFYNLTLIQNPNFNNEPKIRNGLFVDVAPLIPNPLCTEEFTVEYDGQCFHKEDDSYWLQYGGYRPRFPLSVANPDYFGPEFIDNPLYDPNEFIEGPGYNPNEFIPNPQFDPEEFIEVRDFPDLPVNNFKFNYSGNHAGENGGAIYVEGPAEIRKTLFAGNTADDDGGAIHSLGSLEIYDSQFERNWAGDDGGAIRTSPGEGNLLIARSAFIENVAMDDGGAIRISTYSEAHYDDVILSSLFEKNEAFEAGGAISSSFAVLVLNTFSDNKSSDGKALDLGDGVLTGNVFFGSSDNPVAANITLIENENSLSILTLPQGYGVDLVSFFQTLPEFYSELPNDSQPQGVLAPLGVFITQELDKDFNVATRHSSVSWTAGHLQQIFPEEPDPTDPEEPTDPTDPKEPTDPKDVVDPSNPMDPTNPVNPGNSGSNPTSDIDPKKPQVTEQPGGNKGDGNIVVVSTDEPNNNVTPILITQPVLTPEELIRLAQLRAEQLAAELARQQEAEKAAAERLAKIKADKLAREKARALAAEKRKAQVAALKAKIAATQARGEALKKKPSWINLMKHSSTPTAVKQLVMSPAK